jgi:hypothetical protein
MDKDAGAKEQVVIVIGPKQEQAKPIDCQVRQDRQAKTEQEEVNP